MEINIAQDSDYFDRGWFVCIKENDQANYLYTDGNIYPDAAGRNRGYGRVGAFWNTEQEAITALIKRLKNEQKL